MKTYLAALLLLTASPALSAESPKPEETKAAFTEAERAQALEAIRGIAKNFQVDPGYAAKPTEASQQKTMADVADKALDISTRYIGQVASVLEKVAPQVWRIMIVQQYAKAIRDLSVPWGIFILILVLTIISRRMWKLEPDQVRQSFFNMHNESNLSARGARGLFTFILPSAVLLLTGIIGINAFADSAMYLINPEYYAVKDLLQMLFNHGGM
jgi:hypothetical protein